MKELTDDRRRQVETTKLRYGNDWYITLAAKPHKRGFNNPETIKKALETRQRNKQLKEAEDAEVQGEDTRPNH